MKKIKITNQFFDKETNESFLAKTTIERTNERADEIISKGFAEEVKAPKKKKDNE